MLIADDQDLVRAGLRTILREPFGFTVVGECSSGAGVTGRERDVLALIGRGRTNAEIAVVFAFDHGVVSPDADGLGWREGERKS